MNPEVKKMWVEALRSGEYKQDRAYLRTKEGYCCLGVLCDIAAKSNVGGWLDDGGFKDTSLPAFSCLPGNVRKWSGLDLPYFGAKVEIDGSLRSLVDHNDHGRTFAEIANAIEEQM